MNTTALQLLQSNESTGAADSARLLRRCENVAAHADTLTGPGAARVRAAARALVGALELYEQEHRRLAAEKHRELA